MTAQKGKDLLLKVDDGTGTFVTVAGPSHAETVAQCGNRRCD